jgi:iron complex transport system permease protein
VLSRRAILVLSGLAAVLALAVIARLVVGRDPPDPEAARAFLELRLARVVASVWVGASLAVAGVMLQALLRNPLASPDILGLASGSGLGVMLAAWIAFQATGTLAASERPGLGTGGAAVLGAVGALGVVYLLSQKKGVLDPITLILVGVAVSIMCSAGTMLVRHLLPDSGQSVARLLLGSVRDCSRTELAVVGAATLAGTGLGVWYGRAMDAASLSDDEARSVGVGLSRLRTVLFLTSGVLTAGSVVLAGPIGFVGLICPHAVRLLAGPGHRVLVLGSALAGAALVVGCDALVRVVDLGTGQLPIGVLTSLLGGPVLIWLLRREAGR